MIFGERDRRATADRGSGDTGRPFEAAAFSVAKAKQRRFQAKAVEAFEEKAEPGGPAELAVGGDSEAKLFLQSDDAADLAFQHRLVVGRRGLAVGDRGRGILEDARPQKTTNDFGAKRRIAHYCQLLVQSLVV